ncbi:hypothetical protein V5F77_02315 [Xanthobacter sp. DSM 24535]|uniref:hypothetical protein n=1 Tax=Roseixanthobacter psychrophilus TaxID=3119917 RepID=UPI00372BBC0A
MTGELHAEMVTISREDLRELIREETNAAVHKAFADIGLYADEAKEREEVREDFRHLRRWRRGTDAMAMTVGRAILLAITSGVMLMLWVGFKIHVLKQP